MPRFDLMITRTVVETLTYTVSARDEEAAMAKGQQLLEACSEKDCIEKTVKGMFDLEDETFELTDVSEV